MMVSKSIFQDLGFLNSFQYLVTQPLLGKFSAHIIEFKNELSVKLKDAVEAAEIEIKGLPLEVLMDAKLSVEMFEKLLQVVTRHGILPTEQPDQQSQ